MSVRPLTKHSLRAGFGSIGGESCRADRGGQKSAVMRRRVRWQKHITPDRLSVNGARNAIKRWAAEAGSLVEGRGKSSSDTWRTLAS